jgi:hypothetical protein
MLRDQYLAMIFCAPIKKYKVYCRQCGLDASGSIFGDDILLNLNIQIPLHADETNLSVDSEFDEKIPSDHNFYDSMSVLYDEY